MKRIRIMMGLLLLWLLIAPASAQPPPDGAAVLEEVWTLVNEQFFDPEFNGVNWPVMKVKYLPQAEAANTLDELADVVNDMLSELNTSHTAYYPSTTTAYYDLLDLFSSSSFGEHVKKIFPDGHVTYCGVGIIATRLDGAWFIKDILDGTPAADTDLRVGDRLLTADREPFHPILSFKGKAGRPVTIHAQRRPVAGGEFEVVVTPAMVVPGEMYLKSLNDSARIIERDDLRLAYVRIRSYAGEQYHEALKELVLFGELADADGLVLDIRGGWGGANPEYLNLYNHDVPTLTSRFRGEEPNTYDSQWRKPVVLLIDEGARSGKEILAFGFRKFGIGKVVGRPTAGAVVGGKPILLSDGSLLYLAVMDAFVDGERLEGVGVAPDVEIGFELPYSGGADPQLEKALDVLESEIKKNK